MRLQDNFDLAINGLKANKMRSLLTMLGIIIGVAAVIVMISVGQGASKSIQDRIASMGSNLLMVMPGADRGPVRGAGGSVATLTLNDSDAIAELNKVVNVAPEVTTNGTFAYSSQTWTSQVDGTTEGMQALKDLQTTYGSFFTQDDVTSGNPVVVLGKTVADNLYPPDVDPIGTQIIINKLAFTVVGVLSSNGASMGGQDQDDIAYIPVTTAQRRMVGSKNVRVVNVQTASPEDMAAVQSDIENLLRIRHRIPDRGTDDFNIRNLTSVLDTVESTSAMLTMLLASVAAVSLLVGGIGIMNIMFVSVTERTREIGLRMAVGATESNVRNQFLVEALVLCMIGGIVGIIIGATGSLVISKVAGWTTSITFLSIALSFGFSASIGIFFGYYPAKKAAGLDPIEALRFEK